MRQSALGMEVLKELLKVNNLSPNAKIDCQEEDTPLEHPFYWEHGLSGKILSRIVFKSLPQRHE